MSRCRATDTGYRTEDGELCIPTTDHGDPLDHCTARARCSEHIQPGVLSCPRCVGKTRAVIRRIVDLTALLPVASVESGRIDSEAFNLAGPAADPAAWSAVKVQAIHDGTIDQLPEDDEAHPYAVLGRWDLMLREEYGPPTGLRITVERAADYLESQLDRLAQDEEQDFPLFVREMAACLGRVEAALSVAQRREVGAPCPTCEAPAPRLVLHRVTADRTGASDLWRCPVDRAHTWTEADYRQRVGTDYVRHAPELTLSDMEKRTLVPGGTLRRWANKRRVQRQGRPVEELPALLQPCGRTEDGRKLYRVADVEDLRDASGARESESSQVA